MVLENSVYVSHMSFGALSKEAKISLVKGTALAHSAMCSGEGGILPEEMANADKYIFEEEVKTFARITGHENLHDFSVKDLCTINREISEFTNIPHA